MIRLFGTSLAVLGGSYIGSKMPTNVFTKVEAAQQLARKSIGDEDGAIYFSSLSTVNQVKDTTKWDSNWDKRDPEALVKPLKDDATSEDIQKREQNVIAATATAKRYIILVRHGQYNLQASQDYERYLTDLGQDQADVTGQRLAEYIKHLKSKTMKDENGNQTELSVNFVKSSMTRATQTANIILKHFPEVTEHQTCDLIREGAPCPPDPPLDSWKPTASDFFIEGSRIEAAFRKYIHRADPKQNHDSVDVLVCHGNVIRYFVCRALQFAPEAWLRFAVHNGSITVMQVNKKGDVIVTALGEAGHIPVEKLTFN